MEISLIKNRSGIFCHQLIGIGTALALVGVTGCSSGVAPSKTASGAGTGAAIGAVGGAVVGNNTGMGTGTGLLGTTSVLFGTIPAASFSSLGLAGPCYRPRDRQYRANQTARLSPVRAIPDAGRKKLRKSL